MFVHRTVWCVQCEVSTVLLCPLYSAVCAVLYVNSVVCVQCCVFTVLGMYSVVCEQCKLCTVLCVNCVQCCVCVQ